MVMVQYENSEVPDASREIVTSSTHDARTDDRNK
jgi:hypothetical protein